MRVSLLLFASLREALGQRSFTLELTDGATVRDLKASLAATYPAIGPMIETIACAVDDEYVPGDRVLCDGNEVALIPPVSGGAATLDAVESPPRDGLFWITTTALEPHAQTLMARVRRDENGAVALFYGVVRNENEGRKVIRLEYEAHESMALKKMRDVALEVKGRFPMISDTGIWHRVGNLEIGETSLLVAVSSPHRKEAFDACHWAVDRIKETVPVWKKEYFEGGAVWVEGHAVES